jgi:hypothetical protein
MNDKGTLKGVIDRFEGEFAVIEITGETEPRNVLRELLPRRAKEGDYLQFEMEDGNIIQVHLDKEATQAARKRIDEKLDRLRRGEHLNDGN